MRGCGGGAVRWAKVSHGEKKARPENSEQANDVFCQKGVDAKAEQPLSALRHFHCLKNTPIFFQKRYHIGAVGEVGE